MSDSEISQWQNSCLFIPWSAHSLSNVYCRSCFLLHDVGITSIERCFWLVLTGNCVNSVKNVEKSVVIITNNDDPFGDINDAFVRKDLERTTIQRALVCPEICSSQIFLWTLSWAGTFVVSASSWNWRNYFLDNRSNLFCTVLDIDSHRSYNRFDYSLSLENPIAII